MTTYEFQGRMTALSSISHNGGESFGVTSKLRREKFVQPDGSVEEIPVVSGNGLRGMLRDRGMLHMCRSLGYGVNDATGDVTGLPLSAFYFLFSGGTLTSGAGKALDVAQAREIRELIPLVGIFGGALGNMILPGKVKIGKAIPVCAETLHLLPDSFRQAPAPSIWEYLQEEMYTRKDDEKNEHLRAVIAPGVRGQLEQARVEREARAAREAQEDTGQHQQMMYYVETFAAGTPFYWRITLDDVTPMEFEAFAATLVEFSRLPFIGGKSSVGLGEVSVQFDRWIAIDSRVQAETSAVGLPMGSAYMRHLEERGEAIRLALGAMG